MLTEARDLAEVLGNTEIRAEAMAWRVPALVALGDVDAARRELAELLRTAEQTAQPFILHVAEHYGSAIALCDGRLDAAEATAQRSHEWSRLLTGRDASGIYGIQMFSVRREQGRLAELAPVVRVLAGDADRAGPWRPGLAALLAELGMEDEARRELARRRRRRARPLPRVALARVARVPRRRCAALGDEAAAALLYPELEPFAGTNVMIGHGVACYGAADRYLGMLAGDARRVRSARAAHFERALELNRRMGAATWVAHTAYEYARMLLRAAAADRDRADALLAEAGGAGRADRHAGAARPRIAALGAPRRGRRSRTGCPPREVQILRLVARGLSNREIGEALVISEHTVANHVRSILRKTGCANRTEAASYAHRHGLGGCERRVRSIRSCRST